jgi:hypothetical protein
MKSPKDMTPEEKAAKIKDLIERIEKITETANAMILLQELEKMKKKEKG